jgi:hypothetical protein
MTDNNFFIQNNGSGIWYVIHTLALHAKNDRAKKSYASTINTLAEYFGCEKCKIHFKKFIESHPFKYYWNINHGTYENIGFFKWSWEMHNDINKFLGKKQISLDDALLYYVSGICKNCNDNEPKKYVNKILIPVDTNDTNIILNLVTR